LRLGIVNTWNSRWFSEKDYASQLHEDLKVRRYIKERLSHAGVSKIDMERAAKRLRINIHTARPGIIIGKKGVEIDKLMKSLQEMTGKEVFINIMEVRKPEVDAQLVAENIAMQLERRVSFRRAMKRALLSAMRFGAGGVRIAASGRLAGHEIARREWYREGRVPLHTLRANIDYGLAEAKTTYGIIGIKVWIYTGDKPLLGTAGNDK
jgi:small subunit ribosomal protein S3